MPPIPPPDDPRKIFRVSEIARLIQTTLENELGLVWVEGEISNFHRHGSGHSYFTLKDENAVLPAALFRGHQQGLGFELKDGLRVRAYGQVTAYTARGQYQMIVRRVEEAGRGSLQEAFEKLKQKLAAEGLFDAAAKKPLPRLPQRIGLVTSPAGAALRDMLNVLTRRYRNLHIVLAPVKVQGEGAAAEIAAAIDAFNEWGGADVLIVGRGGGSLEDLWAFNEETVARAVARSRLPIISAVGHETDFTICDFVADLRAPTPSAAAELVVGRKEAFEQQLADVARNLVRALKAHALERKNRFTAAAGSYVFREPRHLVRHYRQQLEQIRTGMAQAAEQRVQQHQQRLDEAGLRLQHRAEVWKNGLAQALQRLATHLRAISPAAVLERGYSITLNRAGRPIRDAGDVAVGETIRTRLAAGALESTVTTKQ
jgi:exodeoxyribonuclease VII large subunit